MVGVPGATGASPVAGYYVGMAGMSAGSGTSKINHDNHLTPRDFRESRSYGTLSTRNHGFFSLFMSAADADVGNGSMTSWADIVMNVFKQQI